MTHKEHAKCTDYNFFIESCLIVLTRLLHEKILKKILFGEENEITDTFDQVIVISGVSFQK